MKRLIEEPDHMKRETSTGKKEKYVCKDMAEKERRRREKLVEKDGTKKRNNDFHVHTRLLAVKAIPR